MPLFGPPNIEKMTEKRDVKGLVKVLKEQADPQLRSQAVQGLLQLRDPQSAAPLYEARKDDNRGVRALAAIALAYVGDSRAVECLIDTLDTGGEISIKLLGMLGGSEAVRPLIGILEKSYHAKSDASIIAAAEALENLGDTQAIYPLIHAHLVCNEPAKPAIFKALTSFGASAVGPLIDQLTKGWQNSKDRWDSIRDRLEAPFLALGAPARDELVESLDHTSNYEFLKDVVALLEKMDGGLDSPKAQAAYALAKGYEKNAQIADLGPEAQAMLTNLLKTKWGNDLYLKVLVKLWGADAADQLIAILNDGGYGFEYRVKEAAVVALGDIGGEKAAACLAGLLTSEYGDIGVQALKAIGKFNDPAGIQAIEGLLKLSTPKKLRSAAIETLDQRNWTPRRDMAGAVYHITRGEWDRFMEVEEPVKSQVMDEVLGLIGKHMGTGDTEFLHLLVNIPDERAVEKLIATLESYSEEVRLAACYALGAVGDARALEALEKVANYDPHFTADEPSNPWAYDHTGGSSDYMASDSHERYPVREAARSAIEAIKQKA